MVAEGLNLLQVKLPKPLAGKTLAQSAIRQHTGCTLIAIRQGEELQINPEPGNLLPTGAEIILIGTVEDENKFLSLYGVE